MENDSIDPLKLQEPSIIIEEDFDIDSETCFIHYVSTSLTVDLDK